MTTESPYMSEEEKQVLYAVSEKDQKILHEYWPDLYKAPVFLDTQELLEADPNETLETRFLTRSDGVNAIYPGCHVAIYGEPGAGKTMLAKYAAQQAIKNGYTVAHIDMDDNRPEIVAHDMLKFGVDKLKVISKWKMSQPDSIDALESLWDELVNNPRDLVIIDSMAALEGITGTDANTSLDFVQRVYLPYVKKLMNAGSAIISIDHTGKDNTRRGAMGSTQKLAKSDLAINVVLPESGEGLVPGELGTVALYIDKDRYGVTKANSQLREYSKGHMRSLWGTFCIPATGLGDAHVIGPNKDAKNRVYNF
jgi:nucleoside-triphosphatase THEP1